MRFKKLIPIQLHAPIFPAAVKYLTPSLGVLEQDDTVTCFQVGIPIDHHASDDLRRFCHAMACLVVRGLCLQVDIARVFHVSPDSVYRSAQKMRN